VRAITRMMEQRDRSTLNYSSRPGGGIHKSKTHCKYGHPLTGENLKIGRKGRVCIACRKRRAKAKNKRATLRTDKKVQVVIDALKEGKTLRNVDGLYGHAYVTGTAPEGSICYLQAPAVTRFGTPAVPAWGWSWHGIRKLAQQQTHAPRQTASLFDHLVGPREQYRRKVYPRGDPTHRWTHDRCRRRSPSGRMVRAYAAIGRRRHGPLCCRRANGALRFVLTIDYGPSLPPTEIITRALIDPILTRWSASGRLQRAGTGARCGFS